jgi:EAL domain-containing protein (putative c-di-GMP-specific phosphodiesterase class I)
MFFMDPIDGVLAVEIESGALDPLGELIVDNLTEVELGDSRALLVEGDRKPGIEDLVRMKDLGTLIAASRGSWLLETLREERLAVHFQPIVSADDAGDVFAYECLLRGIRTDGAMISPARMFDAARSTETLFYLDRTARLRAIEEISHLGLDTLAFINFNPTSIYDPASCLHSTLDAVERSNISAESIVFEVTESDGIRDMNHLERVLSHYRDAGFRVALDDLGSGHGSLNLLTRVRPDFVKLDMELVRDVDADPYKATVASSLLQMATDLGVQVVAEGVETAEQHDWLVAHGADYLQGYYLAYPDPTPPVPACA